MKKNNKNILIGINLGDHGSSGSIMRNTLEYCNIHGGYDYLVIVPYDKNNPNTYGYMDKKLHLWIRVFFDFIKKSNKKNPDGFYGYPYTKRIIRKIKEFNNYKNIFVNLHNIHMANIDLRHLFRFLSKEKAIKKVFYTLHDEWSFTGGCYCFGYNKCNNWYDDGQQCKICPFLNKGFDTLSFSTSKIFNLKKKYTLLLKDKLTLIPVSVWLNNQIKQSFLKSIPSIVNTGECSFEPSDADYSIQKITNKNTKIILTVSSSWYISKGAEYVYSISTKIPSNYIIIVIGGRFDCKGRKNIISIPWIPNKELPKYYCAADVYLSVSQDESLGLTSCEAQIFGVPVVTFGHGGLKETIIDGKSGIIVGEDNNVEKMVKAIIHVVEDKPFKKEDIIASGSRFKKYEHAKKMLKLYEQH